MIVALKRFFANKNQCYTRAININEVYVNRFWIFLAVVIVGLGALFVLTKPKDSGNSAFTGDAKQVQADDHVRGSKEAKVTVIEYGDLQCPSCGAYYSILKQLEATYSGQVKFVFRHFPIISIHPNAFAAARATEAASNQGKFFEMHDKLYETQSSWGEVSTNQQKLFEGYAEDLGLDMTKFKADYVSEAIANRINKDVSSAKQFDISGTPTFIVNGTKIENPADKAGFEKVLSDAITKAGGTVPTAQ